MDLATQTHLQSVRTALTLRLHELQTEIRAAQQARSGQLDLEAREVSDFKDLATQSSSIGIVGEAERRDIEEAQAVEAALQRLDQGRYGDCQDCGEPIAWPRLQVQPAALRCAGCQGARERDAARKA